MATTGELRAIIEELQLIDIGEAASFLGEEARLAEEAHMLNQQEDAVALQTAAESNDCILSCKTAFYQ
ncbi:MAG: hypothetical protein ACRDHZ_10420 [Ktedonobacteraceae bacterium]